SNFPEHAGDLGIQLAEVEYLLRDAKETQQRLPGIPRYELARLKGFGEEIDEGLRGLAVRDHLLRVRRIVEVVRQQLPEAAPAAVQRWEMAFGRLQERGFVSEGAENPGRAVEAFIFDAAAMEEVKPEGSARLFTWALRSPASELNALSEG